VLLKNIHLAPQWLVQLEKKLHNLDAKPAFRLFLTSEIHPQLPANLLRLSQIFVFEPPPGIKANLLHTLNGIPSERLERVPVERSRLYLLLAWFHAVVQERLRYVPLGWSKAFEFNDSDLRCAVDTIDYWLDVSAQGRSNIAPERIPWQAIRTLLAQTVYGGRIDNGFDQRLLESFLCHLFTPRSFDLHFPLCHPAHAAGSVDESMVVTAPEARTRDALLEWIMRLPAESPAWLGLPNNAELIISAKAGI
jgi:dynein heavy chain 1